MKFYFPLKLFFSLFFSLGFIGVSSSKTSFADTGIQQTHQPLTMVGPVVWSSLNHPINSYTGTDHHVHLAWVAFFTNTSRFDVHINAIQLLSANHLPLKNVHNINVTDEGVNITNVRLRLLGRIPDAKTDKSDSGFSQDIPAGRSGIAYFNVIGDSSKETPKTVKLGVIMSFIDNNQKKQTLTVIDNGTEINTEVPDKIASPLLGDGWLVANGAGSILSPHRLVTQASNGSLHVPEQFAIDFVKLKASHNHRDHYTAVTGDPALLKSWLGYGEPIYSATAGQVIVAVDTLPDQVPVGTIKGMSVDKPEDFGGNRVIIKTDQGKYVIYAHLMPNSVSVHVGQRVSSGEQIGRLGNSGNSDGPHLHFQIMDTPSLLNTTGLPFVFNSFTLQGHFSGNLNKALEQLISPKGNQVNMHDSGKRQNQMPLTLDLLDFGN